MMMVVRMRMLMVVRMSVMMVVRMLVVVRMSMLMVIRRARLITIIDAFYDKMVMLIVMIMTLKVHKIEIFFGFDFEICIISLLVMSKY